jgi:hypothetical protein
MQQVTRLQCHAQPLHLAYIRPRQLAQHSCNVAAAIESAWGFGMTCTCTTSVPWPIQQPMSMALVISAAQPLPPLTS